jgi:hypothetical protein
MDLKKQHLLVLFAAGLVAKGVVKVCLTLSFLILNIHTDIYVYSNFLVQMHRF